MKRGDLYRLAKPSKRDPKRFRVYVIVSRYNFFNTRLRSLYSNYIGLQTEVEVVVDEGLKHDSIIRCDELVSIDKTDLATSSVRSRRKKFWS